LGKPRGYLLFGIEDGTHAVVGTSFDPQAETGEGNQLLPLWLAYRVKVDSLQSDDDVANSAGNSPQSSPQSPLDSPQLSGDSPQFDRLAGLSDEVRAPLPTAEPARKNKKLPVAQLQTIIGQLCADRWLSTSELAALVDRDAEKLQSRFLTAMVKSGVLELRYPYVRNRPDQAYRAAEGDSTVRG